HFECYRPNAFVRLNDEEADQQFVNNYELMSFNFGPTLLGWVEQTHSQTYERIREADRLSAGQHNGHGNAIAQAYGHAIWPLCSDRDLRTQIRWGLADFRYRFGREAESLWLPETACNDQVMDVLVEEGLRFVILAPSQAARVRILTHRDSDRVDLGVSIPTSRDSDRVNRLADEEGCQTINEATLDTSIPYRYFHRDAHK